jgi:hypothetical protein
VPLARFAKHTWTSGETFTARVEIAHYGERDLRGANVTWSIRDIASGRLPTVDLKTGAVTAAGEIRVPVNVTRAAQWRLSVAVEGTSARDEWDLWVYPKLAEIPANVTVTQSYDAAARAALTAGKKVLLLWPPARASASTLPNTFLPVFWSLSWFKQQPGTLGILCDPKHPALAAFPTESHSDYQWWDVTQPSRAFILDETPAEYRPIVQVIDDYHRNHKLGAVFETRVGEGKLLVSGFDLSEALDRRPAAAQLRRSLLEYMQSDAFQPATALPAAVLDRILSEAK